MLCCGKRNIKIIAIPFFCLIVLSCAPVQEKKVFVYGTQEEQVKMASEFFRIYELSKTQDYETERKFNEALEEAALNNLGKSDKGYFSYAIIPEGAIYPFSKVRVKCIFSAKSNIGEAKEICEKFFENIDKKYSLIR